MASGDRSTRKLRHFARPRILGDRVQAVDAGVGSPTRKIKDRHRDLLLLEAQYLASDAGKG